MMISKASETLNRNQMLAWINSLLNAHETKIQNLGTGVIYCLLINHFQPSTISSNRINLMPKNKLDNQSNLRKFQQALKQLCIKTISFDIIKVAEMGYQQNWQLITKLYKALIQHQNKKEEVKGQNKILQQTRNENYDKSVLISEYHTANKYSFKSFEMVKTPMRIFQNNVSISSDMYSPRQRSGLQIVEKIKTILTEADKTDKIKVRCLKNLLGLQFQKEDSDLNQLLGDEKNKCDTIIID